MKMKKLTATILSLSLVIGSCAWNNPISFVANPVSTVIAATSSIVYNPTTGENGGFSVNANSWSKASSNPVTYNGKTLTSADKFES